MARLLLVRHAPTPETGRRLTGRLPGVGLGPDGVAAAERVASGLAGLRITSVHTSPIERTRQTAEILAAPHGVTPVVEEGIIEVDFGRWQGRTLAQLRRTNLWRTVVTTPSQVRFPDGESFLEMQVRAVNACNAIAAAAGRATVAVVSHADVIKAVVAHYLGLPLDQFQRVVISPGSVSVVTVPPAGPPIVEAVNRIGEPA